VDDHGYGVIHEHTIRSSVNHLEYRLFVSLPIGYSTTDTTSYPVLYALDGNETFPVLNGARRYLQAGGTVERFIIVGIGYPDSVVGYLRRRFDLTTSSDVHQDSIDRPVYLDKGDSTTKLPSGGAPVFLEMIRRDVIPFVERTYRARSDDRGLLGHSFGGLFALYTAHTAPTLFSRFAIFSPSTWWHRGRLVGQIPMTTTPAGQSMLRVFVAVGTYEDRGMRAGADSVGAILSRLYGARLQLANRKYPGNHNSYIPEAVSASLGFLYADPLRAGCMERSPGPADVVSRFLTVGGSDTTEIERFVRTGNTIWGQVFSQGISCIRYRLTINAGERISVAQIADLNPFNAGRYVTASLEPTAVQFTVDADTNRQTIDRATPAGLYVPGVLASVAQLIRTVPLKIGDSTRVQLANFRRASINVGTISRTSADTIRVWHPNVEIRVRVSDRLEILDGITIPTAGPSTRWIIVREMK
jgi:predicted alpha/beta superfamily hydrolase